MFGYVFYRLQILVVSPELFNATGAYNSASEHNLVYSSTGAVQKAGFLCLVPLY